MKNTTLWLLLFIALGSSHCKKTTELDPALDAKDNPLKVYTLDLQQAKMWLPGRWKLTQVYAMIPNPAVPDVELVIDEKQISLKQGGIQIDKVDYALVDTGNGLLITTNAQPREDNWYVRNPGLYINESRMYFDLGRAMDGPAYEFKKVN